MNHFPEPATGETALDLFDLLLTLAEGAWKILAGALVAAALALGTTFLLPARYESVAVIDPALNIPLREGDAATTLRSDFAQRVPGLLVSPEVRASALASTGIDPSTLPREPVTVRPHQSNDPIPRAGLIELRTKAPTPALAQTLATAILQSAYEQSRPAGPRLQQLDAEGKTLGEQLAELQRTLQRIESVIQAEGLSPTEFGSLAHAQATNIANTAQVQRKMEINKAQLEGLSARSLVTPPTLADTPAGPSRALVVLVGAVAGAFIVSVLILFRLACQHLQPTPAHRARLQALQIRFGRKPAGTP